MKKLKRAIIKEELVALTGDFTKAVLLNQFIYWSERVKDFDKFIEEEKKRMEVEGQKTDFKKQNGWIYKTSEELSEETMLGLSPQTIRRHLKELIDNNWLDERENPNYKWDRTKQYRVNISKIQKDLQKLGYSLEGYPLELEGTNLCCRDDNSGDTNFQKGKSKIPKRKIKDTKMENQSEQNGRAIPETTTDITTETTSSDDDGVFNFYQQNFGTISPYMKDYLISLTTDYGEELTIEAMKVAIENKARSIKYINAVLKNWAAKGIKTVEDLKAAEKERTKKEMIGGNGFRRAKNISGEPDIEKINKKLKEALGLE